MLYRDICKILGFYLLCLSGALIIPLLIAYYYEFIADPALHPQPHSTIYFLESFGIALLLSCGFYWIGRKSRGTLFRKEGIALVAIIWLLTPAISALPFTLSGLLTNPFQAYFEAASGLTATGASIMQAKSYDSQSDEEIPIERVVRGSLDTHYTFYGTIKPVRDPKTHKIIYEGVEAIGKALLFWRSFLQFLGGGGIIILFVAVLPALGVGGKMLFQTEMSGFSKDTLTPRIKQTAFQLGKIYFGLTILQVILLMATNPNMPLFDAITTSFGTLSTGGLSVRNAGIAAYQSPYTDWIVILFMLLGSINFSLYYYILRGKFYRLYQSELMIYLIVLFVSSFASVWYLIGTEKQLLVGESSGVFSMKEAIHYGVFQTISAFSTTGFALAQYDHWPYPIQSILLIGMFIGGMSGSTAGGMRIFRAHALLRIAFYKMESLFRPEMVRRFSVGIGEFGSGPIVLVLSFFLLFITILASGTLLLIMDGCDLETAMATSIGMLSCAGIGFRVAGPEDSFAFLSNFGLVLSSLLMILGRLEIFAILSLLVPAFWKQKS